MTQYLTLAAAARQLGVSRPTVYKWIRERVILNVCYVGPRHLPRIPREEILRHLRVKNVNIEQ
jgi:excisionase family DNA binding protein